MLMSDIGARRVFKGVYPRDRLPVCVTYPSIFVVNTDTSDGPGLHWVAVSFDRFGYSEYFDSFGLPPVHSDIATFIDKNSFYPFVYNSRFLQDMTSSVCGLYVIYYVLLKSRGHSLSRIVLPFTSRNQWLNDRKVQYLVGSFRLKPERVSFINKNHVYPSF